MKIMVSLSKENPELLADIEAVPSRARSKRLKLLATLGLAVLKNGINGTVDQRSSSRHDIREDPSVAPTKTSPIKTVAEKGKHAEVKNKLGGLF